jgi:hypothetical protein
MDLSCIQIKLQSVKLAMKYLKRVSSELEAIEGGPEEEELMLQGVRFAFRVHQVLHDWLQVEKRNHSSIMSSELY